MLRLSTIFLSICSACSSIAPQAESPPPTNKQNIDTLMAAIWQETASQETLDETSNEHINKCENQIRNKYETETNRYTIPSECEVHTQVIGKYYTRKLRLGSVLALENALQASKTVKKAIYDEYTAQEATDTSRRSRKQKQAHKVSAPWSKSIPTLLNDDESSQILHNHVTIDIDNNALGLEQLNIIRGWLTESQLARERYTIDIIEDTLTKHGAKFESVSQSIQKKVVELIKAELDKKEELALQTLNDLKPMITSNYDAVVGLQSYVKQLERHLQTAKSDKPMTHSQLIEALNQRFTAFTREMMGALKSKNVVDKQVVDQQNEDPNSLRLISRYTATDAVQYLKSVLALNLINQDTLSSLSTLAIYTDLDSVKVDSPELALLRAIQKRNVEPLQKLLISEHGQGLSEEELHKYKAYGELLFEQKSNDPFRQDLQRLESVDTKSKSGWLSASTLLSKYGEHLSIQRLTRLLSSMAKNETSGKQLIEGLINRSQPTQAIACSDDYLSEAHVQDMVGLLVTPTAVTPLVTKLASKQSIIKCLAEHTLFTQTHLNLPTLVLESVHINSDRPLTIALEAGVLSVSNNDLCSAMNLLADFNIRPTLLDRCRQVKSSKTQSTKKGRRLRSQRPTGQKLKLKPKPDHQI